MNSRDIINYTIKAFDNDKYIKLQSEAILNRVDKFKKGKLYLEVGGKFIFDPHAARVLPGYLPDNKVNIFHTLANKLDIIYSLNANSIIKNYQLSNKKEDYLTFALRLLKDIEESLGIRPKVTISLVTYPKPEQKILDLQRQLEKDGYKVYLRYKVSGYPQNTETILSKEGFEKDDYIPTEKSLVLVLGTGANSGKMSTCLGQIYKDHLQGNSSGYAKLETFPIWDLPLNHPVNLAYEAATADIGDFDMIDPYHEREYGIKAVNYNRDIEAFEIISSMIKSFISKENFMCTYKSPTDMGVNMVGKAIIDDQACCIAGYDEIARRIDWYSEIIKRGQGDRSWIKKCEALEITARKYLESMEYRRPTL